MIRFMFLCCGSAGSYARTHFKCTYELFPSSDVRLLSQPYVDTTSSEAKYDRHREREREMSMASGKEYYYCWYTI